MKINKNGNGKVTEQNNSETFVESDVNIAKVCLLI